VSQWSADRSRRRRAALRPPDERRVRRSLDNFRRRAWAPAIDAAGIAKPARIYDLRSTMKRAARARLDAARQAAVQHRAPGPEPSRGWQSNGCRPGSKR
jgi:hypothetical protein